MLLAALIGFPFIASESAVLMLFCNPEMSKIFFLALSLGSDVSAYIVPLLYLVLLYMGWRVRPLNFELFCIFVGVSFLTIVLLTPSSPGWFVWVLPFLVIYQARSDIVSINLIIIFSFAYLVNFATSDINLIPYWSNLYLMQLMSYLAQDAILQLMQTIMLFIGGLIISDVERRNNKK